MESRGEGHTKARRARTGPRPPLPRCDGTDFSKGGKLSSWHPSSASAKRDATRSPWTVLLHAMPTLTLREPGMRVRRPTVSYHLSRSVVERLAYARRASRRVPPVGSLTRLRDVHRPSRSVRRRLCNVEHALRAWLHTTMTIRIRRS